MRKPLHVVVDLYLAGGQVADLRAGVLRRADVAITGERIEAVIPAPSRSPAARSVVNVRGRILVPGYIEPHTHIVLANPVEFAGAVLPHGTTTVMADALPLQILARPDALPRLLHDLGTLPVSLRWLVRLHPPAFSDEERFTLERLRPLWRHPAAAAVGEVTRWMDLLDGQADLLAKVRAARADGKRVEGHAPGASSAKLAALARAGITSCHEAVTAQEALDRLRAGLFVMLRHSSIRPDLPALAHAAADAGAMPRMMLTADGPTPAFIAEHGYLDYVIDVAMRSGIEPLTAMRMATLNVAAYFGLQDVGEIVPGARADLNVLRDLTHPYPEMVVARGRLVNGDSGPLPASHIWEDVFEPVEWPRLPPQVFERPRELPVCRLQNDVITTLEAGTPPAEGDLSAVLIDRRGQWITYGLLRGYVRRLGGLATTLNTAFDLLVVGQDPADMAAAAARVARMRGGVAIVEGGVDRLSLPFDLGPFSSRPWAEVVDVNRRFNAFMRERGFAFNDPLFTLLFLTFDSLPWVRLTSRGVWDVRARRILAPSQPLDASA